MVAIAMGMATITIIITTMAYLMVLTLSAAVTAQRTHNNMSYKSEMLATIMSSNSNRRHSLNLENSWVSNQAIRDY